MKYKDYLAEHTTRGCKITHIIGIPLILASIPAIFYDLRLALVLFIGGFNLQLIGHAAFEGNRPAMSISSMAIIYGIVFLFDPQTYIGLFRK